MIHRWKTGCVLASAALGLVAGSSAALADGQITMSDAYGFYNGTDSSGGAFKVTGVSGYNGMYGDNLLPGDGRGTGSDSFLTFCVEYNEHFSFGSSYYTQIALSTSAGGVSGGNPDPISATTARLYREFRTGGDFGQVGSFVDGYNSSSESTAIQNAIWYSEGERTLAEIGGTGGLAYQIWDWANTHNNGALNGVRVLRLWTNRSGSEQTGYTYWGNAQDQLTFVPLPQAAGAGIMGLAGVFGIRYARRRKLTAAE